MAARCLEMVDANYSNKSQEDSVFNGELALRCQRTSQSFHVLPSDLVNQVAPGARTRSLLADKEPRSSKRRKARPFVSAQSPKSFTRSFNGPGRPLSRGRVRP